jgi:hypothetical protein
MVWWIVMSFIADCASTLFVGVELEIEIEIDFGGSGDCDCD